MECVYEKAQPVLKELKKRALPQEASWRGMREEAARLQEHVTQLEHILSTKCVESVRVVPALQEVANAVSMHPAPAMFVQSQTTTDFYINHLLPKEMEYLNEFLARVVPLSKLLASADLAWLAGMAADDGPASTIPAAGCDVFNIPVDRFMILYGAMSLGAWRKRDYIVSRHYLHSGSHGLHHVVSSPTPDGIVALSLYAVIHTYFLQPNACLTYYSCADTCVRALESAQPSAALPPKFKSLLRGYLQAIQVKVHHSAPSLEVCAELDNLKADASPATLGRLNGLCTLTMFACARKADVSEEWVGFASALLRKADEIISASAVGGYPTVDATTQFMLDTLRCALAVRAGDVLSVAKWAEQACATFDRVCVEGVTIIDTFVGCKLIQIARRHIHLSVFSKLLAVMQEEAKVWPMAGYCFYKYVHNIRRLSLREDVPLLGADGTGGSLDLIASLAVESLTAQASGSAAGNPRYEVTTDSPGCGSPTSSREREEGEEGLLFAPLEDSLDEEFPGLHSVDASSLDLSSLFGLREEEGQADGSLQALGAHAGLL